MADAPTYTQSMKEAKGHGQAFLQSTVGQHPVTAAVVMGILVIIILVLIYYVIHYKTAAEAAGSKSAFGVRSVNNLSTGNNNPLWFHGAGDAGWGGPVHRETTAIQAAAYMPHLRQGNLVEKAHMHQGQHFREGMAAAPGGAECGAWDPAASAEAQALATIGSFKHDSYGEERLQGAVNSAYDSAAGLSDDHLQQLMHQGGAP
jgi:hypothetical protein